MNNDHRQLRGSQSSLAADLGRSLTDDLPSVLAVVLVTVADPGGNPYPTTVLTFYPVKAQEIEGDEAAGASLTLNDLDGAFYAANLGTAIPPQGTEGLIGILIDGVICFRYNG